MLPKSKYFWLEFCIFSEIYHFFQKLLLKLCNSKGSRRTAVW